MKHPWIASGLTSIGLATLSHAQLTPDAPPFDASATHTVPWTAPSHQPGDPVGRTIAVDLNGDAHTDLVSLDAGRAVYVFGPGLYESCTELATGVLDLCVAPGLAPTGDDALALVSQAGVELVWIDYDDPNDEFVRTQFVGGAGWESAQRVRWARGAGPFHDRLVGIDETGTKLLGMIDPAGAALVLDEVTVPFRVLDVACADWSGDAQDEILLLTVGGLFVANLQGGALEFLPLGSERGSLVPFRVQGDDKVWVGATLTFGQPAQTWFFTARRFQSFTGIYLGGVEAYAGAAGDVDRDGDDDVVLATRGTGASTAVRWPGAHASEAHGVVGGGTPSGLLYLENVLEPRGHHHGQDPLPWDVEASHFLDLGVASPGVGGSDPGGHTAHPVLADLSNDGDVDLAWFSRDLEALLVSENAALDHTRGRVGFEFPASSFVYDHATYDGVLSLVFEPPADPLPGANTLLVHEWVQVSEEGLYEEGAYLYQFDLPTDWSQPLDLLMWNAEVDPGVIVTLDARLANLTPEGAVVAMGPSATRTFSMFQVGTDWLEGEVIDAWGHGYASHFHDIAHTELNSPSYSGLVGDPMTQPLAIPPPDPEIFVGNAELGVGAGDLPKLPPFEDEPGDTNPPRTPRTPPPPPPGGGR